MKNIYEIISEQKMSVDINIASYDLNHVTNYLIESKDEYYISEGLGDNVKNISAKIVEFIKNIMRKISELIKKMVNWLFGKKNTEAKLNKEIENINNGKTDSEEKSEVKKDENNEPKEQNKPNKVENKPTKISMYTPQEKKEIEQKRIEAEKNRRKNIKKAYKVVYNIEDCIKACRGEVEVNTFEPLPRYIELGNRFFSAIPDAVNKVANGSESWEPISDLRNKTFKRLSSMNSYDNENNMTNLIRAELIGGVSENKIKKFIAAMADDTMFYIRHSDQLIQKLNENEKKANDNLNKLLRTAQASNDDKKLNNIQKLASFIGQFVNALVGQIKQSRDAADAVAKHAIAMYREQVRRANGKY